MYLYRRFWYNTVRGRLGVRAWDSSWILFLPFGKLFPTPIYNITPTRFNVHVDPVAGISAPTVSSADMAKLEKHFMSHRFTCSAENCIKRFPVCMLILTICNIPSIHNFPGFMTLFKWSRFSCSGFSLESLNGFMFGVDATKSLILTVACIERVITVEEAVRIGSNLF